MKSLGSKPEGARLERIKASRLWAGESFQNMHPVLPDLRDPNASMPSLHDFLCGGERRVPRAPLPSVSPLEAWSKPPASGLRATWLGHSTLLIEIDGVRVLLDPVWGPRASPSPFAGPKRFQPVPVALRAMPLLRIKGELVLLERAQNSLRTAEEAFRQSIDSACQQGALSWELRSAISLSRLWHAQGRTNEARTLLTPVYARFTEGFGTSDLQAAKILIDAFG